MSHKQSPCSVFRYKTEHKSLNFLPTSELLRTQRIRLLLFFKVMRLKIYLNTFMSAQIISLRFAILTVFVCIRYRSILIDQCRACKISSSHAVCSVVLANTPPALSSSNIALFCPTLVCMASHMYSWTLVVSISYIIRWTPLSRERVYDIHYNS